MPRICYATGTGTKSGNTRSHSMRANRRTFKPNLIVKKVTLADGTTTMIKVKAKIYKKLKGFL